MRYRYTLAGSQNACRFHNLGVLRTVVTVRIGLAVGKP